MNYRSQFIVAEAFFENSIYGVKEIFFFNGLKSVATKLVVPTGLSPKHLTSPVGTTNFVGIEFIQS